jgi:hypothetical protein
MTGGFRARPQLRDVRRGHEGRGRVTERGAGIRLADDTGSNRPSDYSAQTQCSQEALSNGMDEVRYCRDMISRMRTVPPEITGSERFCGDPTQSS